MLFFFFIYPWFNVFWTGFNFIAIVPDYGNKYVTKEMKIEPVWKILHQNWNNLNHNIDMVAINTNFSNVARDCAL